MRICRRGMRYFGVLAVCALCCLGARAGEPAALVEELFEEGQWAPAMMEGLRLLEARDLAETEAARLREKVEACKERLGRRGLTEKARSGGGGMDAPQSSGPGETPGEPEVGRRSGWSKVAGLPAGLIVGFYRSQIGPAIGERCVLHPGCSQYFLEACEKHGPLGFAMLADRLFREPQASSARDKAILLPDGRLRFADPVSDHDFWMKQSGAKENAGE